MKTIQAKDLAEGDRTRSYTIETAPRVATKADAKRWAPQVHEGDILATVRWTDGGSSDRAWDPDEDIQVDRP
jgi:hypothetical protein